MNTIEASGIKICKICGCPIDMDDWFGSTHEDICASCSEDDTDDIEEE